MAGEFKFEMFIDAPTAKAIFEDGQGVDPCLFPNSEVPFKKWSADHSTAAKFYALAHRTGAVHGVPVLLLEGSLPEDGLLPLFKSGSVRVYERMQTVAFTKLMDPDTFPGLILQQTRLSPEEGQQVLDRGVVLLYHEQIAHQNRS